MNEIIKSPQDNIKAYLINEINIEIFNIFECITYEGKPQPLEFFNLLFSELDFFNANISNYCKIKEHFTLPTWEELENGGIKNLNKTEFYFGLVKLISGYYAYKNTEGVIKKSCEHIEKIYHVLFRNTYGDIKSRDTFKQLQQDYKGLNHNEQIKNWIDIKYSIRQDLERHIYDKDEAEIFVQKIDFELERLDKIKDIQTQQPKPTSEPLDLSDTSAVEKIIYLNELGIIDFLRTKTKAGISNTALASVLSGITGIKAETIKPSLNRLSNNDTIDNKHPYYTTKTVEKIKTFLIKLGF